ncbi:uncharacterized protein LOC114308328 [Camellia sinensis]|uniref:uncharacterized protein LOC114308328 n=1 Tax=Camellia sinensis TaxID=4442 RepID=UPI001036E68B|nr:uncharacterized protein LOC114308328 [Camellia sinensis]
MGLKKAVVDDLLADIPNVTIVQSPSSQSLPKPKPKRLKKAQAKETAIQHADSFAMQAFDIKKELVNKTKEAASLLKIVNKAEAKMKTLMDQAKLAKQAQEEADEKAGAAEAVAKVLEVEKKEAEAKTAEAQAELIVALATKEAEIKAADEKAFAEEAADVKEDYKKQVKQDEEDKVSKDAILEKTTSDVPIAEKSID